MKKQKAQSKQKAKRQDTSASRLEKAPDLSRLAFPEHLNENKVIEELRETVEKLRIFDNLGKTLTSVLDLNEILRVVVQEFGGLIGSKHMGLALLDQKASEFYFQYPQKLKQNKGSYPLGHGLIGKTLERGKAQLFIQPAKERSFSAEIDAAIVDKPGSMICLPILSKGAVLGAVIFVTEENEADFTKEKLKLVESFSDYLAIAVENATNYQKVQDLTITDDLTALYNSRYLPVVLEREIARSRRYKEDLSLVFIDLDNFKQVNDSHGHLAGSQLLTEFGNFLFHQIRTTDIGIRYGGDEFVLVLPRTPRTDAIRVIQRAIDDLRDHVFLKSKQLNLGITASFGIATFPENANSIDSLIAAADRAMYDVKGKSKNGLHASNEVAEKDNKNS